jgi:hypothetical protein
MKSFDVSRAAGRVQDALGSPARPGTAARRGVRAFAAGLFLGIAIGAVIGLDPFRRSTVEAGRRVREVGGDMVDRARDGLLPAPNDESYVSLPTVQEPAVANGAGEGRVSSGTNG